MKQILSVLYLQTSVLRSCTFCQAPDTALLVLSFWMNAVFSMAVYNFNHPYISNSISDQLRRLLFWKTLADGSSKALPPLMQTKSQDQLVWTLDHVGNCITEDPAIKCHIRFFFTNLFTSDFVEVSLHPEPFLASPLTFSPSEAQFFSRIPSSQEIKKACLDFKPF